MECTLTTAHSNSIWKIIGSLTVAQFELMEFAYSNKWLFLSDDELTEAFHNTLHLEYIA